MLASAAKVLRTTIHWSKPLDCVTFSSVEFLSVNQELQFALTKGETNDSNHYALKLPSLRAPVVGPKGRVAIELGYNTHPQSHSHRCYFNTELF